MSLQTQAFDNLAVTGMDVAWGGCDGIDAFERLIYTGSAGNSIDQSEGKPGNGHPADPAELLLGVTRRALADAGYDQTRAVRIAVLLSGILPEQPAWQWAGQVSRITAANPLPSAIQEAYRLLDSNQADVVVYAASAETIQIPGDAPLAPDTSTLGFERGVHGWRFGEGAGAVVLERHDTAQRVGKRIYALLHSLSSVDGGSVIGAAALPVPPALDSVRACCQAALQSAGISAPQIGYVEAFASGVDALDGIEIAGLAQAYRQPVQGLVTALGSAQAHLGYLGSASGLAGLLQTVLCLYHRMVPGFAGWSAPKLPALWRGAPFYVLTESRAWFQSPQPFGRLAGLSLPGLGGSYSHMVLGEAVEQVERSNQALEKGGFFLFPLAGDNLDDLMSQLESLRQALLSAPDLDRVAMDYYETATARDAASLGLSIVGHHPEELLREIEMAQRAVPAAFEKGGEWQTPLGSYFTAQPVGRSGGVALVYPGAFNSYPGVGKDLLRLFPELYQRAEKVTDDLGSVFRERQLYPRSLTALSKEDLVSLEAQLLADPIAMLISGAALAILYTHILQESFGIQPVAAFGYSLGENSMMFATGVWAQGDPAAARLEESESFRLRLAGPQKAIREYWGMDSDSADSAGPLWSNYLVMAAPEKVQAVLEKETRVYLTHINTPRQVVIGGDPAACQRVVAELKCSSLQAPFDYALHCAVMRSEYDALAYLHDWPVEVVPGLKMYSAADYGPVQVERHEISQKIAHMLTTPLDFPRLINTVYSNGSRVFVEVGAGSNCARWIDETLKASPHLALSLNRRGTDDYTTLVRTMARLYSHRVPVNLERLYSSLKVRQNA